MASLAIPARLGKALRHRIPWGGPTLDRNTRSLMSLAMLTALLRSQ
jgi:alkylhydroperoxidase/carboxymuconolactone decarboxylase family protein YurZ